MPYLQELKVGRMPGPNESYIDLSKCPNLTSLTLFSHQLKPRLPLAGRLLPCLTTLDLRLDMDMTWQILTNAPSLTNCRLLIVEPVGITFDSSPIHLPNLVELTLATSSRVDPGDFLDSIRVPSLRKLQFDFGFAIVGNSWPHLNNMLRDSRPPLESLSVWSLPISEDDLLQCLHYVPSLKTLDITLSSVGDALWLSLTYPDADSSLNASSVSCLCPELTVLCVRHCGHCSRRLVQSMVISRSRKKPLRTLALSGCGFKREELFDHPEFRSCLDAGLKLEITEGWD